MLGGAGEILNRLGDSRLPLQYHQEALNLARQIGDPATLLFSLKNLAYTNFALNQFDTARRLMQETANYLESVEELPLRISAQMNLGVQQLWSGLFSDGIRSLESVLPIQRSLGRLYGVVYCSVTLGLGLVQNGEYVKGEGILKAVVRDAEQGDFGREAVLGYLALGMAALAQEHLTQAGEYLQQSVLRYRQMHFAGELGWALGGLALAQEASGQTEAACNSLLEALNIAAQTQSISPMITCFATIVSFLFHRGHLEAALRVHRLAMQQPVQRESRWYADVIGNEMEARWEGLSAEEQAEIEAAVEGHTPFSIIPEVLDLLEAR